MDTGNSNFQGILDYAQKRMDALSADDRKSLGISHPSVLGEARHIVITQFKDILRTLRENNSITEEEAEMQMSEMYKGLDSFMSQVSAGSAAIKSAPDVPAVDSAGTTTRAMKDMM